MAAKQQAEDVKAAILARSATRTTHATLEALLDISGTHQLASRLPPKSRHALATEAINASLKVLSRPERQMLRPISGNETPKSLSPMKASEHLKQAHSQPSSQSTDYIEATAECASSSFAYLRAAEMLQPATASHLPKSQLEAGMLALASKMITHGLHSRALDELRIVKSRIQRPASTEQTRKAKKATLSKSREKPTMASLLCVHLDNACMVELLPIAITYQCHILRIISASKQPATVQASLGHLQLDAASSPANFILEQARQSGDVAKSAKQLQSLSTAILSLCPSASSSSDDIALDTNSNASPLTVFKLQCLALELRTLWWSQAGHRADLAAELLNPFSRCVSALLRRSQASGSTSECLEAVERGYKSLDLMNVPNSPGLRSELLKTITLMAQRCGKLKEARGWAKIMVESCADLDNYHSRKLAALCKLTMLSLDANSPTRSASPPLNDLRVALAQKITGNAGDLDELLADLACLAHMLSDIGEASDASIDSMIDGAARYAANYARSYPNKGVQHIQTIFMAAIAQVKPSSTSFAWLNHDSLSVLLIGGVLRSVATVSNSTPLLHAWSSSALALSLGKIINAHFLQGIRQDSKLSDTNFLAYTGLTPIEHGCVLEWLLQYVVNLAERSKYHVALRKIIPGLLRLLAQLYPSFAHPVRRARVACTVFQLRESQPNLLSPESYNEWRCSPKIDPRSLGQDNGLSQYVEHINTTLAITKDFTEGAPSLSRLNLHLDACRRIVYSQGASLKSSTVCDIDLLRTQLTSIAIYLEVRGENSLRLAALGLLQELSLITNRSDDERLQSIIDVALLHIELGHLEVAAATLDESQDLLSRGSIGPVFQLYYRLARSRLAFAGDNLEAVQLNLCEARTIHGSVELNDTPKHEKKLFERLHAEVWLLQSQLSSAKGYYTDALLAGKCSVRLYNGMWTACERQYGCRSVEPTIDATESAIDHLSGGISKLQLKPKTAVQDPPHSDATQSEGAAFWPLTSPICRSLLHLSDLYIRHGLFSDALYYCKRASKIASSVNSSTLIAAVESHHCRLLALSGQLEDAELRLERAKSVGITKDCLTAVDVCRAEAEIRTAEERFQDAIAVYTKCEMIVRDLQSSAKHFPADLLERPLETRQNGLFKQLERPLIAEEKPLVTRKATGLRRQQPDKDIVTQNKTIQRPKPGKEASTRSCYLLEKLAANLALEKALLRSRLGENTEIAIEQTCLMERDVDFISKRQRVMYGELVGRMMTAMRRELCFNALAESTLALPAYQYGSAEIPGHVNPGAVKVKSSRSRTIRSKKNVTDDKRAVIKPACFQDILCEAQQWLATHTPTNASLVSTVEMHVVSAMRSGLLMHLSASSFELMEQRLLSQHLAHSLEAPRSLALGRNQSAIFVDRRAKSEQRPTIWPSGVNSAIEYEADETNFQQTYVDILPDPWTAVSLSLSDDGGQLYVARYRAHTQPFIVRLPFARDRGEEDAGGEPFDYKAGKAELLEIIECSNQTCHNGSELNRTSTKKDWWNEREALNRRLQELLTNMENIWFGGFKGLLSARRTRAVMLERFRRNFEAILERHLPSRRSAKAAGKKNCVLADEVLELFIGLFGEVDRDVDLDESLTDLLYFVVDILQFHGEANAYDEIDFDGFTVELLDCLQACQREGLDGDNDQHLILVLDRRLQTFPWENLPCLQSVSVSRLDSMKSLRECILAMRGSSRHHVSTNSGSYILNPSSDLNNTQTLLGPCLSSLGRRSSSKWTAIANRAPSEEAFSSALTESTMTLYFGHGAGSQYIRPRTIKKLDRCSEVVWLMGCSSGAVTEYGCLEPFAVPLAYLLAGTARQSSFAESDSEEHLLAPEDSQGSVQRKCMSVLATLWDVTDKDIDRFSVAVGEEWGLWPAQEKSSRAEGNRRKEPHRVDDRSTAPKTPKTARNMKVVKSSISKTPTRHRYVEDAGNHKRSLVEAVSRSRDACYLRYLNGAAPVVYGVPVYLAD